jgi:quaternary ammonium compound-resistance protein SugE
MAWIHLIIAGLLEIFWAVSLKYTDGFANLWPSVLTVAGMIASFYFLARALKTIPVGMGYAIWTGIGAAGTAILGVILFSESASWPRLACVGLIVAGIVGLKLTSNQHPIGMTELPNCHGSPIRIDLGLAGQMARTAHRCRHQVRLDLPTGGMERSRLVKMADKVKMAAR